jgi:hypothetical protein
VCVCVCACIFVIYVIKHFYGICFACIQYIHTYIHTKTRLSVQEWEWERGGGLKCEIDGWQVRSGWVGGLRALANTSCGDDLPPQFVQTANALFTYAAGFKLPPIFNSVTGASGV